MDQSQNNNIDSILDLGGEGDQPTPPGTAPGDTGNQPPAKLEADRVAKLEESNKKLQETVQKQSAEIEGFSEFKNRIMGNTKDIEERKKMEAYIQKYDNDPLGLIDLRIAEGIAPVKTALELERATNVVLRAAQELDKEYDINWDKDYEKINAELRRFDKQSKKDDPQGSLLAACKLAGTVKKKVVDVNSPHFTMPKHTPGSPPIKNPKHDDAVNQRMNSYGSKGKKNIFKI